ncbi:hypothetical protein C7H19_06380 [Aphanothece hegewaldii CCALA 016]|uniref:Calcium-binding protein n=1 Tax=Aphanothece hegewaldii CCALA 016 TaxID=2107694 RepID=A0A2T1M092_9CHRO|nr:hypothetical protein [Aphanothece hegewaldii]PSF38094.1 hypothetical protein C7H19_06380 [Aphanothece hegewaldii CCALA 016]
MTANLFDVNYYRQANPDLAINGVITDEQLTNHFFTYGVFEAGRQFSRLADLSFYRASNSDLASLDNLSLYNHLANNGVKEGRRFSPFYDTQFYQMANPDLIQAGLDNEGLFNHVQASVLSVINENRRFSPFFDIQYYRQTYSSELGAFDNAGLLEHFKVSGINEGRKSSPFVDVNFYLQYLDSYKDLAATRAAVNNNRGLAFRELQSSGLRQGQRFSPIVDLDFYRDYNPDLAYLDNGTLFNHLVLTGSTEGRRLSASYDPVFYSIANSDLTGMGSQQLLNHFVNFGINEYRQSSDSYSGGFYLGNNSDLLQGGLSSQQALNHYEIIGLHEGRRANSIAIALSGTPGTFFGNATNLGAFTSGRSGIINEAVNNSGAIDVYRFTVAFPSNVSLQINNLTAPVNYFLVVDRNGNGVLDADEYISNIQTSSTSNIGGNFAAGTYYLIVQQATTNQPTNYRLNLSSNGLGGINTSRDPGETTATALNLGVLSTTFNTIEFNDFIGTSDLQDIYRFTTTDQGNFNGQIFNISSSVIAEIFIDSNKNEILEDGEIIFSQSGNSQFLLRNIPDEVAQTYYIRIRPNPSTNKGTYSLGYTFT